MIRSVSTILFAMICITQLHADDFGWDVPMHLKGANTFYISGQIGTMAPTEFMVDTGSSYMTINEETLAILKLTEEPLYLRDLTGILANGDQMKVPVYAVSKVRLGESCMLEEVEVAVFPGNTRQIVGLSVLTRAAPFVFSTNPPQLQLSNCGFAETKTGDQTALATGIENL